MNKLILRPDDGPPDPPPENAKPCYYCGKLTDRENRECYRCYWAWNEERADERDQET